MSFKIIGKASSSGIFWRQRGMVIISQSILLFSVLLVAYPVIFLFFTSLKTTDQFFMNIFGPPTVANWGNYVEAWTRGNINIFFKNSVIVTISSVIITVVVSTLGGYALGKMQIPRSETIIMVFMTFSFIPGIAIYITLYKMLADLRMTQNYAALILPYSAWHIPFSMFILKKFFQSVPMDIIESARVDGCGELRTFLVVVLPLVQPALASVVVFAFINCWGELMWAQIVTSATLFMKTLPIGLLSFRYEMGVDWGPYAAGLCLVTLPLMGIFAFFQKYFIAGLTQGAIKG